jgi:hypothetical protein
MASSFRRSRGGSSSSLLAQCPGTKPSAGGVTLTSSGLRDLDQLLSGGQPLGTCLLLEEDRWTRSLGLTLIKYWCAQVRVVVFVVVGVAVTTNWKLDTEHLLPIDLPSSLF